MEFFRIRKDIPFMRHAVVLNAVSAITFLAAVFFLFSKGLNLSVEFTGGTVMEVAYEQPADLTAVRRVVESLGYAEVPVQNFGTSRDVLLRLPVREGNTSGEQSQALISALKAQNPAVELRRTSARELHMLAGLAGESIISNEMSKRIAEMITVFIDRAKAKLEN